MKILEGAMNIRPTDKLFSDSPDTGHSKCICSRCGEKIKNGEMPIRMWTEDNKEYRFCEFCMTGQKFFYCKSDMEVAWKCKQQCEECKSSPNEFFL